jgi:hypothetical protein
MKHVLGMALALALVAGAVGDAGAQAPIETELTLITPVSKFIHDAALKAFAEYAKERWNVTVRTNAIPAGTPVAYGRIVEWKGKPDADIFWGGESALFEKHPGLDRKAEAHSAQGPARVLGRHRAGAVRARLPPGEDQAIGSGRAPGLGGPAQPQAEG